MRSARHSSWLVAGLAASLLACAEPPAARAPDVLLVVLDTVRADRCSAYGYSRPTTIQLEALAEVGVLFEDVTAPGAWTLPSHASLFTGLPPWQHGADYLEDGADGSIRVAGLGPDLPTLAERFAAAGYRTVSIAANDWLGPGFGLTRGFESARVAGTDADALDAVGAELARESTQPLFLFVNLMAAHSPYENGPGEWGVDDALLDPASAADWIRPYLLEQRPASVHLARETPPDGIDGFTRYLNGRLRVPADGFSLLSHLYDAGVRGADFTLGRILERWVARAPNSIVAVTSDHGEAFDEHGLVEHRGGVYPELTRVPLVIAAPAQLPTGSRVREPVQLQDLHPTLLDLAGIESSPGSLVPVAKGERRAGAIAASAPPYGRWAKHVGGRFAQEWRLYRRGVHALVWTPDGASELYDVTQDPAMRIDLASAEPERTRSLRNEAVTFFDSAPRPTSRPLEIPAETLERLRSLGYATR